MRITRFLFGTAIALAIALALLGSPRPLSAAPANRYYTVVNTTADEFDTSGSGTGCSLREAIYLAAIYAPPTVTGFGGCSAEFTAGFGTFTIYVNPGTYTLTLIGTGENADATGDLDIGSSLTISASGAVTVTGMLGWDDRLFDIWHGNVTIKGLVLTKGHTTNDSGASVRIETGYSLALIDSVVTSNYSSDGNGGGISNLGTLTLTNVIVDSNYAAEDGAGIYNLGNLTLNNVTVSENHALANWSVGGGIYNETGTASLTNVSVSGNVAGNGASGIYNYNNCVLSLTSATISSNSNTGVYNDHGTLSASNVTVSGNTGPGIFNYYGTATLTNATLANNNSQFGSDIGNSFGTVTVSNSIMASGMGPNCYGALGGGYNLSSDNSCSFGAGRDNINVMLMPLRYYGGPTLTQIPFLGSPAIDFGTNPGCPLVDQRGMPRPFNGTCDVGAVERQAVDFNYWVNLPLSKR